jgi:hypothetical protein
VTSNFYFSFFHFNYVFSHSRARHSVLFFLLPFASFLTPEQRHNRAYQKSEKGVEKNVLSRSAHTEKVKLSGGFLSGSGGLVSHEEAWNV